MPDLDMIDRASAPGWHKPYWLLKNEGSTPAEIGHALIHSLCRSLRRYGGVPRLDSIVAVVEGVQQGQCTVAEAFRRLRAIEQAADGHRHTRVAVRAAHRMIAEIGQGGQFDHDPARRRGSLLRRVGGRAIRLTPA